MTESKFNISFNDSIKLLEGLGLFKDKGKKPVGKHSSEVKKIAKKNRHKEIFDCVIKNLDYDIILKDDSIFQFTLENEEIRYAFIQNPNTFITKEEYLEHYFHKEDLLEMNESELQELINGISDFEYEQFLNEQELNITANIIRYDATKLGYEPLLHSFSHFHIGNNQDLRIPTDKIITPLKFTKFCIKNSFYALWKAYYKKNNEFKDKIKLAKSKCLNLPESKWKNIEKSELYLT